MLAIGNQIDLDVQQVLHSIGYDTDCEPPARIVSLVNEYIENAHQLIEPSYSYVIRKIEWVHDPIAFIEGSIIFKSQVIARLLAQCKKLAVFLVTIGTHLEETACRLAEDKLVLQAAVLDAIGSNAAEKVANRVQDQIGKMARAEGLAISRRFSPGYCDWNIGQQRMVFQAMNGDSAEVNLTDGCLMLPRKSISGIIGIGATGIENYNPCKSCDKHDCVGRR